MLTSTNFKLQIMKMVPLLTRTNWVGVGDREKEREGSGKDRGREKGGRDDKSCENTIQACPQVAGKMAVTIGREEKDPTDPKIVVDGD